MQHAVPIQPTPRRWATYLAERFPLARHGIVVAAFVFGALSYAGAFEPARPAPLAYAVAFVVALLFFLELRIADEFKDADDDARYRPYRPVPRGLVTLRELAFVATLSAATQFAIAAVIGTDAVTACAAAWGYLLLMWREFFVRRWLRAHAGAYIATHALIVPLIALAAMACAGRTPPLGAMIPFLALAYATSIVFEIGRKIRPRADEREGVETYTALWGARRAIVAWLGAFAASASLAVASAYAVRGALAIAALGVVMLIVAFVAARRFTATLRPLRGEVFATIAGAWLIVVYVALGVAALFGGTRP